MQRGNVIKFVLLFTATILTNCLGAQQTGDMNFMHITVRDGLTNNTIQSIYQDYSGEVWIGTLDGLNCYNGYNVKNFFYGNDSVSIPHNHVTQIAEDQNLTLWIGTMSGLSRFNRKSNDFETIPDFTGQSIRGLKKTKDNKFYVTTTEGVYFYDAEFDRFSKNDLISNILGNTNITSEILELENGVFLLMIGTQPMIFSIEKREMKAVSIDFEISSNPSNLTLS